MTCILNDSKHNKTFTEIINGENKLKNAEREAARRILNSLDYSYYFSEEQNIDNEIEYIYVLFQDKKSRMLIKLYKGEQCFEYCYLRGHKVEICSRRMKRNKNSKENYTVTEEDLWTPVNNTKNQNLIYIIPLDKMSPTLLEIYQASYGRHNVHYLHICDNYNNNCMPCNHI